MRTIIAIAISLICGLAHAQETESEIRSIQSQREYRQRVASESYAREAHAKKQLQIETDYGTLLGLLRTASEDDKPHELPVKDTLEESTTRLGECYLLVGKLRYRANNNKEQEPQVALVAGDILIGLQFSLHSGERIERVVRAAVRSKRTVRLKVIRSPYVYLTPFGPGAVEGSLDLTVVDAQLRRTGNKWGPWLAEYPVDK